MSSNPRQCMNGTLTKPLHQKRNKIFKKRKTNFNYLISRPTVVVPVKIVASHFVRLGKRALSDAGHFQDLAAAAGRGLGVATLIGIALVAWVAGAQGPVSTAVDDASGVVAALVHAARVQGAHLVNQNVEH